MNNDSLLEMAIEFLASLSPEERIAAIKKLKAAFPDEWEKAKES